ncbi:BREX system P-loop protein BrxC [Holophaga foetida]|uniref:BREX system P-loop protein BrxC n=1 Tax=Holophaga foetida TaxID=35839 RepID=UPI000247173A|nr:BREX system P-loop protein BrxC [Holophaga foetida]
MQIQDLFERRIARAINGVVKADQMDDASVWQELDEFVVTRELNGHMAKFLDAFASTLGKAADAEAASKNGVWISGFFGSGKSHFIKVLSYLLKNDTHRYEGQERKAAEFFQSKVEDAMILGDIRRVATAHTDVILFNIDSKADTNHGRDAILRVFLKVFNEMQGFCADHPEIAYMERHLTKKGQYQAFVDAFLRDYGSEWEKERDAKDLLRDHVIAALSEALAISTESAEKFFDSGSDSVSITPENFSRWVKEYLDEKGPQHRIVFLVDEVGQFIGSDSHLMLSLQTITENLGTICEGRAWVVVTSQEDIDAVLGQLKKDKAQDFSKIQGRFKTRLSLSSTNVDEVILKRLLEKKPQVTGELQAIFRAKGDILKHQTSFQNAGMTFRHYKEADDFAAHYPFAPYQFQLIQKIFEAIRKHGATGAHLSRGERSILDAFQSAAKQVAEQELGVLVPLYRFYPSIESFLDTAVKRTIDQAKDNEALQPFDVLLLQVLFLIRYVEEMKADVDNLASLCAEEIDQDRIPLKRRIEESLARLEKETLISRNGEIYFFLTNEERDINREIKNVDVSSSEEATTLGKLIFEDVYKDNKKFTHLRTKRPFVFNRECDQHAIGHKAEAGLPVLVITPLADDYDTWDKGRCLAESAARDGGAVVIKLGDTFGKLQQELRMCLQVERYNSQKNDGTLPPATLRILQDLAAENRKRRERLVVEVGRLLEEADTYVAGQPLALKKSGPQDCLFEALGYLVDNTFTKMGYLHKRGEGDTSQTVLREIQAVLRANDVAQARLGIEEEESNPQAIKELRDYLYLMNVRSTQVVLHDLVETRFSRRPYGWPEEETLLLVARLLVLGEIHLVMDGASLALDKVFEAITNAQKRRKITLVQRKALDPKAIQTARQLGKDVFAQMGPDGEDPIVAFLRSKLEGWQDELKRFQGLEGSGYPGKAEVEHLLKLVKPLLAEKEGAAFLEAFSAAKNDLLDGGEDFHTLSHFFGSQRPTWDRMRKAYGKFELNRLQIEEEEAGKVALRRLKEILQMAHPYTSIMEGPDLIAKLEGIQNLLVAQHRQQTKGKIAGLLTSLGQDAERLHVSGSVFEGCVAALKGLLDRMDRQESIPHLKQAVEEADQLYGEALHRLEAAYEPPAPIVTPVGEPKIDIPPQPKPVIKKPRVVKPAELAPNGVLENQEEVDAFLVTLRTQLEAALANHERIQIR